MKWTCAFALWAAITFIGETASATDLFYLRAQSGAVLLEDCDLTGDFNTVSLDFEPGFAFGGSLGILLDRGRLELEVTHRENDIEGIELVGMEFNPGGSFSSWSFMLNSFAEYPNYSRVFPFIMVGGGGAVLTLDEGLGLGLDLEDDSELVFAYQAGAGVSFAWTDSLHLDLDYRYFATLDPEFSTIDDKSVEAEYRSHNLFLSARLSF